MGAEHLAREHREELKRLRAESHLLNTLLTSGRLWWDRHEPVEGLGYRIKRVPLNTREDVEAEIRLAGMLGEEGEDG
jgi:hypothetical protein